MTVAEREKAEADIYRKMAPEIVEALIRKEEPVALAEGLAQKYGLETALVYKWFQLTEAELESARKRAAVVALIPVWVFAAVAAGLVVAVIAGGLSWSTPWVIPGILGALVVSIVSGLRLRGLTRRVYRRKIDGLMDTAG